MNGNGAYLGKYRGTVASNLDPLQMGRIQAIVPDVSNIIPTTWALPCVPFAGIQTGFFTVPPVGSGVWIEFEQGDLDYPIWTGCYWGSQAEVPAMARAVPPAIQGIAIQTSGQNGILISDLPGPTGGIIIKTASGAMITVNDIGITITNGQGATITMTGPTVDINAGALTVI
jgi:uncharacterized protein involved in type VI secretion and phage assembly